MIFLLLDLCKNVKCPYEHENKIHGIYVLFIPLAWYRSIDLKISAMIEHYWKSKFCKHKISISA